MGIPRYTRIFIIIIIIITLALENLLPLNLIKSATILDLLMKLSCHPWISSSCVCSPLSLRLV
jgi:hypothetical protein